MDDFEKDLANQLKSSPISSNSEKPVKLKKDGMPMKRRGPKPKVTVVDAILPAQVNQAGKPGRKYELKPKERDAIREQLVQYYGSSKVDKFIFGVSKMTELAARLCRMRDTMEKEIDAAAANQEKYFAQIDKEFSKIGRPNAPFTFRELDYLCSIDCKIGEIAGFFDLDKDTLRKKVKKEYGITFREYHERRSQGIKIALRRAQIHNAIDGDTAMQKFLGINMLGQKQKVDFEGTVQVNTFADLVKNLDNKAKGISDGENNIVSDSDDDDLSESEDS